MNEKRVFDPTKVKVPELMTGVLTKKQEDDIDEMIRESNAVHKYLSKKKGFILFRTNDEFFKVFDFARTGALLEHSKKLGILTWALIGLTIVLGGLTVWDILLPR